MKKMSHIPSLPVSPFSNNLPLSPSNFNLGPQLVIVIKETRDRAEYVTVQFSPLNLSCQGLPVEEAAQHPRPRSFQRLQSLYFFFWFYILFPK